MKLNIDSHLNGLEAVPKKYRAKLISWYCGPEGTADDFNAKWTVGYAHGNQSICIVLVQEADEPLGRIDIIRMFDLFSVMRIELSGDGKIEVTP